MISNKITHLRPPVDYARSPGHKSLQVFGHIAFLLLALFIGANDLLAQGSTCQQATCISAGLSFPAVTNGPGGQGATPVSTCLFSSPNETWFYFEVSSPGTVIQMVSIAPSADVDYAVWGPFANPASCASLSSSNNVSCDYTTANGGTMNYTASVGYYLMVIANFSNASGQISLSSNSGTATMVACSS